jgi:hypothetical protein
MMLVSGSEPPVTCWPYQFYLLSKADKSNAFIGYQAVLNLLPNALLVLGGDIFLTPFLNGRQPVLEDVHVARRSHSCLSSLPCVCSYVAGFIFS